MEFKIGLDWVAWLLKPDVLTYLVNHFRGLFPGYQGMYEVLSYKAELEFLDAEGKKAIYRKQQKVKFLQDNIIAYQDQAWGDGEIFAEYRCSPGVPVDRYREGNIYRILISLRETKNRGDLADIFIERTILNGFTKKREYFQNRVNHPMRHLVISVIFPPDASPKNIVFIEHNRTRSGVINDIQILPDGRKKVTWETSHPRLHELYSIRWE